MLARAEGALARTLAWRSQIRRPARAGPAKACPAAARRGPDGTRTALLDSVLKRAGATVPLAAATRRVHVLTLIRVDGGGDSIGGSQHMIGSQLRPAGADRAKGLPDTPLRWACGVLDAFPKAKGRVGGKKCKKDANVECNVSQLDSIFPRTTWRRRWMSRLGLGSMHLCKNAVELRRKMTLTRMSPTCNVAAHRLVTETTRCARSTSATATQGTEAPVFLKFKLLRASVAQILTTYTAG